MIAIEILVAVLMVATALAIGSWALLAVELFAAKRPVKESARDDVRPRFAVLIPAHDEESCIAVTLATVRSELGAGDRCLVIADNCSDRTAEIAVEAGAEVVVRNSLEQRGKGYALQAGVEQLRTDPPSVVLIVDADCRVVRGSLAKLALEAATQDRPVQGSNLLFAPKESGPSAMLSAFAFLLKNHIRPLGLGRLGGPCLLFGTGMALPWRIIEGSKLATGDSVEDMKLALDLAVAGTYAAYCPIRTVEGEFPTSEAESTAQRKRWEHGHVRTAITRGPRLLFESFRQCRWPLALLALDLMILPLGLLATLTAVVLSLNLVIGLTLGIWWGAFGLAFALVAVCLAMTCAWWRFGREHLPGWVFAQAPVYVARKIPIYLGLVFRRQAKWQKTLSGPLPR